MYQFCVPQTKGDNPKLNGPDDTLLLLLPPPIVGLPIAEDDPPTAPRALLEPGNIREDEVKWKSFTSSSSLASAVSESYRLLSKSPRSGDMGGGLEKT